MLHLPHLTELLISSKQFLRCRCGNKNGWGPWSGTSIINMSEVSRSKSSIGVQARALLSNTSSSNSVSSVSSISLQQYARTVPARKELPLVTSSIDSNDNHLPSIHQAAMSGNFRQVELCIARDLTCINALVRQPNRGADFNKQNCQ